MAIVGLKKGLWRIQPELAFYGFFTALRSVASQGKHCLAPSLGADLRREMQPLSQLTIGLAAIVRPPGQESAVRLNLPSQVRAEEGSETALSRFATDRGHPAGARVQDGIFRHAADGFGASR